MKNLIRMFLVGLFMVCSVAIAQAGKPMTKREGPTRGRRASGIIKQKDMRTEPIQRVVALGESTTWGYSATSKDKCWVNQTVGLLEEFQGQPIELINQGIGANVLTPRCPAYLRSAKPSASERVDQDLITLNPDLVFLSYGLNDSRGGITAEVFREEYQRLIDRIRSRTEAIIVILNVYYMHASAYEMKGWNYSNYSVTEEFNQIIADLAKKNGLILVDVWSAEKGVDWIIGKDRVHPNDLGHRLIANRVFEAIARNCSFVTGAIPKQSGFRNFVREYGNGPDRPSSRRKIRDVTPDPEGHR